MHVFVLNTGRCGSTTFAKACQHMTNFTAGHETRASKYGTERFDYPDFHIEVDNRLSWHLGHLNRIFGQSAYYVHLTRNKDEVANSYLNRWDLPYNITNAFANGIRLNTSQTMGDEKRRKAAYDYIDVVNTNIEEFLRDKKNVMRIQLENIDEQFPEFWTWIEAKGNLDEALAEFKIRHNPASAPRKMPPVNPAKKSNQMLDKTNKKTLLIIGLSAIVMAAVIFLVPLDSVRLMLFINLLVLVALVLLVLYNQYVHNKKMTAILRKGLKSVEKQSATAAHTAAVSNINSIVRPAFPFIWNDDYMINPGTVMHALREIMGMDDPYIVECGPGVSTVVFATALKNAGAGKVVAIEHDERYLEITRREIEKHGLSDYVDFVHAPLRDYSIDSKNWQWYDIDKVKDHLDRKISFLLVDGPPGILQPFSRYPALPMLFDDLSTDSVIFMDDYAREDEQEIVRRWRSLYPGLELTEFHDTPKGAAILRRPVSEIEGHPNL